MPPQFVGIQDSGEHRTSGEGAQGGSTRVAQRQARLEPSKGKSGRTASGSLGTLNSLPVTRREGRYSHCSDSRLGFKAQSSGRSTPPRIEIRNPPQPRQLGRGNAAERVFRLACRSLALHVAIVAPKQARGKIGRAHV